MPRVLVTDAGLGSAISVIRSLGRRGMHVIAADSDGRSPGFYSRYVHERVRYPPPKQDPEGSVATLLRAARDLHVDLIVPVTDEVILPIAAHRARFEEVCTLALPEPDSWSAARDKAVTLELARSLAVPTPRTAVVHTLAEAREAAAELGWPVVLKPHVSRIYREGHAVEELTVGYAGGFARVGELMSPLERRCPVLIQEYYSGEAHGVELLAHEGRPLAAFQHRRLREVPITGGASSFRESVALDPTLYDYAARLLGGLKWTGLAMVEFKLGPEGPRLMEINGRIWGSLPLAVKAGMDFPAHMVDLFLSGPPGHEEPLRTTYDLGVRSRHLELEVVWIGSVLRLRRRHPFLPAPPRRDALLAALRLLDASDGYDILSRDDPRPGVAELVKIAGKLRTRARGGDHGRPPAVSGQVHLQRR